MLQALALALQLTVAAADGGTEPVDAPDAGAVEAPPARDPAEAKRLLVEERAKLNAILDKQQSLLDALEAARTDVGHAESAARAAGEAERQARQQLQRATAEADAAQAALTARIISLRPRLAARYRLSHGGAAALLFGADSLGDLLWRRRTLTRVLGGDLELLRAAKAERARLVAAQAEQARSAADVKQKHEHLVAQLGEARHKRDELDALMKALSAQRDAKERLVQELGEAASHVDALAQAPAAFAPRIAFDKLKGRLPQPVAGRLEVGFGRVVDPQFGTVLIQKGIDLRAEAGLPVQAVAPGRVAHAGELRGYGNLVIVDHGGGFFTLYAHLEQIEHQVGDAVNAGDRIGTVGETGSLKGPYLYFEIRHHGTPLNPAEWLKR